MPASNANALRGSPASFEDLPRELRDMVYHELWRMTFRVGVVERSLESIFRIYYDSFINVEAPSYGLPQWLRCCKMFLREGMCQLLRRGTWNCRWPQPVTAEGLECHGLADIYERCRDSQLINPTHFASFGFVVTMKRSYLRFRLPPMQQHSLSIIAGLYPNLKNLAITARHDQFIVATLQNSTLPASVDLSQLESSSLQLNSITIHGTVWYSRKSPPLVKRLQEAYAAELTRIGQVLVCPNGQAAIEDTGYSAVPDRTLPSHVCGLIFAVRFSKKTT